jgi:hypothetical protein
LGSLVEPLAAQRWPQPETQAAVHVADVYRHSFNVPSACRKERPTAELSVVRAEHLHVRPALFVGLRPETCDFPVPRATNCEHRSPFRIMFTRASSRTSRSDAAGASHQGGAKFSCTPPSTSPSCSRAPRPIKTARASERISMELRPGDASTALRRYALA